VLNKTEKIKLKNMNKFLQACIGVAIVLFAAGFLIRSVQTANAETPAKMNINKTFVGSENLAPVGIANGNAYYFAFDINGSASLEKVELAKAD
jgi:hypothetical protein